MRVLVFLIVTISSAAAQPTTKLPVRCPFGEVVVGFDEAGKLICQTLESLSAKRVRTQFTLTAKQWARFKDMKELSRAARVVPYFNNGTAEGFKIFGIRPSSVVEALGLKNGDIIRRVGVYRVSKLVHALEANTYLNTLKPGDSFEVELVRKGLIQIQTYTFK